MPVPNCPLYRTPASAFCRRRCTEEPSPIAAAIIEDGRLDAFRSNRYAGWQGELGKSFHAAEASLGSIADHAIQSNSAPEPKSGRQEWCENLINSF